MDRVDSIATARRLSGPARSSVADPT